MPDLLHVTRGIQTDQRTYPDTMAVCSLTRLSVFLHPPIASSHHVTLVLPSTSLKFPSLPKDADYDTLDAWRREVERVFQGHSIPISDWLSVLADHPTSEDRLVNIIRKVHFQQGPGASPQECKVFFRCAPRPRPWDRFSTLHRSLVLFKQTGSLELYLHDALADWAGECQLEAALPALGNLISLLIQGLDVRCSAALLRPSQ